MNIPHIDKQLLELLAREHWDRLGPENVPLPERYLVGIRDFSRDCDDIWCDAMVYVSPTMFLTAQADTDHSRAEWDCDEPIAVLNRGCWAFTDGLHAGNTLALRQMNADEARAHGIPSDGRFSVTRVYGVGDRRNYQEAGFYGIDIHHGVISGRSVEGHQILPPHSAEKFIRKVLQDMWAAQMGYVWYLLMDSPFECD